MAPASAVASTDPFEAAVAVVLKHEGGFVNHPSDPGGATNYGISLRYLKSLGIELGDVDLDGDVDIDDIKALTPDKAKAIYRREWWDRYGYFKLPDIVGTKVFDLSVNMGAKQAHRLLQRALRACGKEVIQDGVLGPKTLSAAHSSIPEALLAALRSEAAGFYRSLIAKKPELSVFETGWMNRAYA